VVYILEFFWTPEILLDLFSTTTFGTCSFFGCIFVMSHCFNKSQILGNISEHPYVTIEYIYNLIDGPGCVSIVQNGCLVVKEELWLKTPYHVVQLLHRASAAQNAKKTFQPCLALLAWPTWSLTMHFGSTISQLQAARPILPE